MKMEKEKSLVATEEISKEIDKIVLDCSKFSGMQIEGFSDSLALAAGIKRLREIFLHPGIKEVVEAMQDTRLGFLTDRSPAAIARAKKDNKTLYPYTYAQVSECCIEAMLKGFRISNNEFNIIAYGFYAAKNGKYRKSFS